LDVIALAAFIGATLGGVLGPPCAMCCPSSSSRG
jgi:hypothetical protein